MALIDSRRFVVAACSELMQLDTTHDLELCTILTHQTMQLVENIECYGVVPGIVWHW
jgi:hypothetical protein